VPAEDWDPAELLLNAMEYLDMYGLFAFEANEPDRQLAINYLESARDCIEDAQAALIARFTKPSY
jgi:hypothetical protein